MAGRVHKSRSVVKKLLVFGRNGSPLARGRLQNAKLKEQIPIMYQFGTTETFPKDIENGEKYSHPSPLEFSDC